MLRNILLLCDNSVLINKWKGSFTAGEIPTADDFALPNREKLKVSEHITVVINSLLSTMLTVEKYANVHIMVLKVKNSLLCTHLQFRFSKSYLWVKNLM